MRPPPVKGADLRREELTYDPLCDHLRFQALLEEYRDDVEH